VLAERSGAGISAMRRRLHSAPATGMGREAHSAFNY
jgi:hypothetical protein